MQTAICYFNIRIENVPIFVELLEQQKDGCNIYQLTMKKKIFKLEEHIAAKNNRWKILAYTPDINITKLIALLTDIGYQIEKYFKPKKQWE